ncbi:MAG: VWA domain-containing protein [Vicinamibacteria bacterium]
MNVSGRRSLLALCLSWHVANSSLAAAQTAGTQKTDPPVFKTEVALVAVPVFVTDKSGKSVAGLTAEDFELQEDGKRVPIAAFQEIDVDARPSSNSIPMVMTVASPDASASIQSVSQRQFLIVLDTEFSPPFSIPLARKAATAFLRKSVAPGDLVAAAVSDPSGIKVLSNFTSDHESVARAILSGRVPNARIPASLDSTEETIHSGNPRLDEQIDAEKALLSDVERGSYQPGVDAFLENMSSLVQRLARLRGRKQMVLLSGGFAEGAWDAPPSRDAGGPDLIRSLMWKLFREAGEADVVIHTINLNGIYGLPRNWLEKQSVSSSSGGSGGTWKNHTVGRDTMAVIAINTGGLFVRPTNNFGQAFREVDQVSRHSYVLAFQAPASSTPENRQRRLKVVVRRRGLSVSHRPSYSIAAPAAKSKP